jgi:hemerythrin
MTTLQWDKRLETGITQIDDQHKEIFKRIADFGLALLNGKEKAELIKLIGFLESYAAEHFDAEEKVMRDIHHPEFIKHLEEHNQFRDMCKELASEYRNKGVDQYLALQTEKKLIKWWENHILKSDMSFTPHVKKEGA